MADARLAALGFLEKCRRADAWSDAVLGSVMDSAGLEGRDRGLCTALCYGVMQNRILLDSAVAAYSSVKLNKLEPKVLDILRLSAYQLYRGAPPADYEALQRRKKNKDRTAALNLSRHDHGDGNG